jgi:hypothetical protein
MNDLSWPHLLYVSGDVDYAHIQAVLSDYDHFPLGPQCWIVKGLGANRRESLHERLKAVLPRLPEKAELLLCPLSPNRFLDSQQDGFGLYAWLKKLDRS